MYNMTLFFKFASLAGNDGISQSRGELINIGEGWRHLLVHDVGTHIREHTNMTSEMDGSGE